MHKRRSPVERLLRSLRSGVYEMLILEVLASSPGAMHGYRILSILRDRGGGVLRLTESIVYEALRRLERDGLLKGEWVVTGSLGPPRRVYTITREGLEALEAARREARRLAEMLGVCS